jgi:hypothetical protein
MRKHREVTNQIISDLKEFLEGDEDICWHIDDLVFFEGDWLEFARDLDSSRADLLATSIRSREQDPGWLGWKEFLDPSGGTPEAGTAAALPLLRYSRRAAEVVLEGFRAGWEGPPEAVIPSLIARAGLLIEDIGGDGTFCPPERRAKWYTQATWKPGKNDPAYESGKLHFPVVFQDAHVPKLPRFRDSRSKDPRILFAIPVGKECLTLVRETVSIFLGAGADVLVFQYEDCDLGIPDQCRVIRQSGQKWQFARRHLAPENVSGYDYIFFWDDDLDLGHFDPRRFIAIMDSNRLSMAQPAIESLYPLSHQLTARRPVRPPLRFRGSELVVPVVGRLTNFVEIMAPVFSRDAWEEIYGYISDDNLSGWGYDYIPLGKKGIVDAFPVVHTRPVQSINEKSQRDLYRFLREHGLFAHQAIEQGWLFEEARLP